MSDKPENEAEVVDLDIDEADLESSDPAGGGLTNPTWAGPEGGR